MYNVYSISLERATHYRQDKIFIVDKQYGRMELLGNNDANYKLFFMHKQKKNIFATRQKKGEKRGSERKEKLRKFGV
jgi:hypothetical protein